LTRVSTRRSTDEYKRLELARVIATLTRDLGSYAASYRDFCELIRLQEAASVAAVELGKSSNRGERGPGDGRFR